MQACDQLAFSGGVPGEASRVGNELIEAVAATAKYSAINVLLAGLAAVSLLLFFGMQLHRLDAAPTRRFVRGVVALLLVMGFFVLGQVGAATAGAIAGVDLAAAAAERSLRDQAVITLGAYAGQALALVAFAVVMRRSAGSETSAKIRWRGSLAFGLATFVLAWPVLLTVTDLAARALEAAGFEARTIAHSTLRLLIESPVDGWHIALSALAVIVAPLMEEVIYRGLVQSALVQALRLRWAAIVLTSAIFTLMHASAVEPHALVTLFVLSLAFGWVYERTGSLAAPITVHILFNLANFSLALYLQ